MLAGLLLVGASPARAQVTNAILQASVAGTVGIEETGQNSLPKLSQAGFNTAIFGKILGLPSLGPDIVLALNYDVTTAGTNLFLTVYDRANKEQITRVTDNESTVWFFDADEFIFRLHAQLPARFPSFGGGELTIVGHGKFAARHVPSAVSANVRGTLVDAHGNGIPGVILRATLKTSTSLQAVP